jgi:hypothetical protein
LAVSIIRILMKGMPGLVTVKRFAIVLICLALCAGTLTGCGPLFTSQTVVESFSGPADVEEYVSAVKLEIRSGILYVTVYDGTTYKTTIEADEISVLRPEFGRGTVSTATIYKDHQEVAYFSRSYVQETNMTKKEIEEEFGPVKIVATP